MSSRVDVQDDATETDVPEPTMSPFLARRKSVDSTRGGVAGEPTSTLMTDGWKLFATRGLKPPRPWSPAWPEDAGDWPGAFAATLAGLAGGWQRLKHDASGTVAAGTLLLGGRPVPVVAKRPRRTRAGQALVDLLRPSRARRAWSRTWRLLHLGFATEVPLLLAERRWLGVVGGVGDAVAVYGRVPGPTIQDLDFAMLEADARQVLLRRVGRTLRDLADAGLGHFDAKATNWIAYEDAGGLLPVLIDCDGVRPAPRDRGRRGMDRFLRSLRERPDADGADLAAVEAGFAATLRARERTAEQRNFGKK